MAGFTARILGSKGLVASPGDNEASKVPVLSGQRSAAGEKSSSSVSFRAQSKNIL